jgi:hypothetical protein
MDLELHILCKVSTMIMTELDSSTFSMHSQEFKPPKSGVSQVVHESGPLEWFVVHEGSPWTRSTKVVHGPGVRVLSFPIFFIIIDSKQISHSLNFEFSRSLSMYMLCMLYINRLTMIFKIIEDILVRIIAKF